jgi:hypothetical protein
VIGQKVILELDPEPLIATNELGYSLDEPIKGNILSDCSLVAQLE